MSVRARTTSVEEPVRLVARFVDHALHVEAVCERVEGPGRRRRQTRRGHIEEAVEVDAQRGVHAAAPELGGGIAAEGLMQRVGGGERVVHGVPVAVVVLDVEAQDPQRGRIRERASELFVVRARVVSANQRVGNLDGVIGKQLPRDGADIDGALRRRRGFHATARLGRELHEIVRMAPLGELLGALRGGRLEDERRQHA